VALWSLLVAVAVAGWFWSVVLGAAEAVAAGAAEVAAALWSVVVLVADCAADALWSAGAGVVLAAAALWSVAEGAAAVAGAEPTLVAGVWLVTGAVVVAVGLAEAEALWSGVAAGAAAELEALCALASAGGVFMLLEDPLPAAEAAVTSAEVPAAEAEPLPHESEIMLTEVTFKAPLFELSDREPCTST
jgi:hypothetical protein